MADANSPVMPAKPEGATGVLVLANGEVAWGRGFGAEGQAVGEVCFHTAMTGYQEIMTDPSFAGQIITFTLPAHRQCRCQPRRCRGRPAARGSARSCAKT